MTPEQVKHLEDLRLKALANKRLILKGRRNELEEIRSMLRSPAPVEAISSTSTRGCVFLKPISCCWGSNDRSQGD